MRSSSSSDSSEFWDRAVPAAYSLASSMDTGRSESPGVKIARTEYFNHHLLGISHIGFGEDDDTVSLVWKVCKR